MSNLFEKASRLKLRFESRKGELTVEQLWDLRLAVVEGGTSLDSVARSINAELKALTDESFVVTISDPRREELVLKLDIVKYIIAVRMKEAEDHRLSQERAAQRHQLMSILAAKESEELQSLSKEELQQRIAAL